MSVSTLAIRDAGRVSYETGLTIQTEAVDRVLAGGGEEVGLLEHTPVVTLGRNADLKNLLVASQLLGDRGIEVITTRRGGDITCHFPGQLVVYPILRLAGRPGGVRQYVCELENIILRTLTFFGIEGVRIKGRPGVYVGSAKIASIGIALRRWVSFHGFSVNLSADLELFGCMRPCGHKGEVTSINLLSPEEVGMDTLKKVVSGYCRDVLTPA